MSEVFRVIKNKGYTVMSNKHLFDKRISAKATTYLSIMLALPPEWDYTISGLARLKTDGLTSVRTAIKELEKFGYISRKRARNELGQVKGTEYLVYEDPNQNPEYDSIPDNSEETQEPKSENLTQAEKYVNTPSEPKCDFPTQGKPTLEKPTLENRTQLNTNILNTKYINNNLSNQDINNNIYNSKPHFYKKVDKIDYQKTIDSIATQISASKLYKNYSHEEVDELIEIIAGVYLTQAASITVQNIMLDTDIVRNRLKMLEAKHIVYVLDCVSKTKTKIIKCKSYLLTALYNAPMSQHSQSEKNTSYDLDEFEQFAMNFNPLQQKQNGR